MMILPLLVIFLAAAVPGFDGATLRIGVFVSPDTIRDWARIKHGTFATLKSAMEGGLQSEVSDVFSTSQGFPWNVNVRFSSIEQISQSKVDEWINNAEAKPEFSRSAPFARDFCTYVNRVKGTRYDVGILVLSKAEQTATQLAPASAGGIGTLCNTQMNANCLYMKSEIIPSSGIPSPVWHELMGHELGHLFGGLHPLWEDKPCHDIMASPGIKSPNGLTWGSCTTPKLIEVQSDGGLGCVGL